MGHKHDIDLSPYSVYSRADWATLRADTPLMLGEDELERLRGLNEPVSMEEVVEVYLPISRLISLHVAASQQLFAVATQFLGTNDHKTPFIIGLGGSVAVGKSTTARILQALLARWPDHRQVELVPTDGFLFPNAVLEKRGILNRKGFPESYDRPALLKFLADIKAGKDRVHAPAYSHFAYDILPGREITIDRPDILILEGLNVLETGHLPKDGTAIPFVSDYFDFSIYIDAGEDVIERWYRERFLQLCKTAFRDAGSYFHKYAGMSDKEANEAAGELWDTINLANLREHILPTRQRADLILHKRGDHVIDTVAMRKL